MWDEKIKIVACLTNVAPGEIEGFRDAVGFRGGELSPGWAL